eukprot:2797646-Prymnesium_polylepis.1
MPSKFSCVSHAGQLTHPGFFSRNIEGRCARRKVAVQTKRSTTTRKDRKLRIADCGAFDFAAQSASLHAALPRALRSPSARRQRRAGWSNRRGSTREHGARPRAAESKDSASKASPAGHVPDTVYPDQ